MRGAPCVQLEAQEEAVLARHTHDPWLHYEGSTGPQRPGSGARGCVVGRPSCTCVPWCGDVEGVHKEEEVVRPHPEGRRAREQRPQEPDLLELAGVGALRMFVEAHRAGRVLVAGARRT